MSDVLLRMENISKSFPGVRALDNVSLEVRGGEVHALMGENGAGKSTLMKCLFGIYTTDSGKITLEGVDVSFGSAREALESGVAMVHQELNLALKLSVMDNMFLGRIPKVNGILPFTSESKLYDMTKAIFDELGLDINPREKCENLSVSKRQMLEIARAISYRAKIIVFDEPTSSLNEKEAEKLFEIITSLKKRGCGIIYISHKMDEIFRISDRITVMRDGKYITTKEKNDITMDEVIRLMVGRVLSERYPEKNSQPGEVVFSVEGLSSTRNRLKDISFNLRRGEILGIAGLDGSGRTETLECIFGLRSRDEGEFTLNDKKIENKSPRDAIKSGFALVSEERRASGIFPVLSILENTVISSLEKFNTGPILSKKKMRKATLRSIRSLGVKTPSERSRIDNLSGGNQQKVIIGRWLLTNPKIMMMDEPTRGIDVGAKYEIYKLIIELAKEGRSVFIVSSEMSELLGLADRIVVLYEGKTMGVLSGDDATQEEIMKLQSGEVSKSAKPH